MNQTMHAYTAKEFLYRIPFWKEKLGDTDEVSLSFLDDSALVDSPTLVFWRSNKIIDIAVALRPFYSFSRDLGYGWFKYKGFLGFSLLPVEKLVPIYLFSTRYSSSTLFFRHVGSLGTNFNAITGEMLSDGAELFESVPANIVNAVEVTP